MTLSGFQQYCRRMATLFAGLFLVVSVAREVWR